MPPGLAHLIQSIWKSWAGNEFSFHENTDLCVCVLLKTFFKFFHVFIEKLEPRKQRFVFGLF